MKLSKKHEKQRHGRCHAYTVKQNIHPASECNLAYMWAFETYICIDFISKSLHLVAEIKVFTDNLSLSHFVLKADASLFHYLSDDVKRYK